MAIAIGAASFALRPSIVVTVIEDGAVLLDLDTKYFYRLNAPAWALVSSFELDGMTHDGVRARARSFGATDDAAVTAFLRELDAHGLLEETPAGTPPESGSFEGAWCDPRIEVQSEPLQSIVTSAFDPSVPLAE